MLMQLKESSEWKRCWHKVPFLNCWRSRPFQGLLSPSSWTRFKTSVFLKWEGTWLWWWVCQLAGAALWTTQGQLCGLHEKRIVILEECIDGGDVEMSLVNLYQAGTEIFAVEQFGKRMLFGSTMIEQCTRVWLIFSTCRGHLDSCSRRWRKTSSRSGRTGLQRQ